MIMAPEVLNNFNRVSYTEKADCWALGLLLYQLLCGNSPEDTEDTPITNQMGGGRL